MKTKTNFLAAGLLLATFANGFGQAASSVQFSSANYTVAENGGTAIITVNRNGNTNDIVSVDYTTRDGTATAGVDYTPQSGTLTFVAGERKKTFTIPILDDGFMEGDETVNLILSNPIGGAVLGLSSIAVLTIQDNERPVRLDSSFDPGRGVTGTTSLRPFVLSVTALPDGKVLVAGGFDAVDGLSRTGIARLNLDGSLDRGFDPGSGAGGADQYSRDIFSVVAQADGKLLIAGVFTTFNGLRRSGLGIAATHSLLTFRPAMARRQRAWTIRPEAELWVLACWKLRKLSPFRFSMMV